MNNNTDFPLSADTTTSSRFTTCTSPTSRKCSLFQHTPTNHPPIPSSSVPFLKLANWQTVSPRNSFRRGSSRRILRVPLFVVCPHGIQRGDKCADALCAVKRSKNTSLIGIEGIVVLETAETFKLVTVENVIKGMLRTIQSLPTADPCPSHSYTKIPRRLHHHIPSLRLFHPPVRAISLPTRHAIIPRRLSPRAEGAS